MSGIDGTRRREIEQLLAQRRKIEAIKLYREATGVGLKDAKDAVEALEAGQRRPDPREPAGASDETGGAREVRDSRPLGPQGRAQVLAALRQGRTGEAIGHYRADTGVGSDEAERAVAALALQHGLSEGETIRRPVATNYGRLWLAVAVFAALVYLWLRSGGE